MAEVSGYGEMVLILERVAVEDGVYAVIMGTPISFDYFRIGVVSRECTGYRRFGICPSIEAGGWF